MTYQRRGTVRLHGPVIRLFGVQISPSIWAASWPFGKLECHDDSIFLEAWPARASIQLQDVDYVEFKRMNIWRILLGDKLEIRHHAGAPNPIIFSWYGLSSLVQVLEQNGVAVVTR